MKLINILSAIVLLASLAITPAYGQDTFDTDTANVTMTVGLYASITGLDDFALTTTDIDGSAGAVYDGSDNFNVESNGQVRVVLSGANLTNGSNSVSTVYELDSTGGTTFDTTSGVVHNASHSVSAEATLGAISDQLSGNYASTITLTVSAL